MADYKVSDTSLTAIADAIRTKGGTSADLSFPAEFVSAIGAIPTGGGSTLITKSITANGTYYASDDSADGYSEVTVTVPTGATNVVTGTFTGTTTGAAMSVSLPYTGSGYPIGALVFPSDGGYNSDSTIYTTLQRYAVIMWGMAKTYAGTTPAYSASGTADYGTIMTIYKTSASDATSTTGNRQNANTRTFSHYSASNSWADCLRFNSATSMSVYMASDSYGFMAGIQYTYVVLYSS